MRILLLIAALLMVAGGASATNENSSGGSHHHVVGPGDQGCAAGCVDVGSTYGWNAYSNDDVEDLFVNACMQGNEPNQYPSPGSNSGVWYRDAQGATGTTGGLGVCTTLGDFVGFTLLGGQGVWIGQEGVLVGHNQNVYMADDVQVSSGENVGSQTSAFGAFTYVYSGAGGTCAYSSVYTPNGGVSVGPFCD